MATLTACEPKEAPQEQAAPTPEHADYLEAPAKGDVRSLVAAAAEDAIREGRTLIVYVGASWCEPCRYFSEALHDNALPEEFAAMRFLKFDGDRDGERLAAAGYQGSMLPRFILPGVDGAPTVHGFEGSIKGPAAIDNLVPKLRALLAAAQQPAS